MARKASRKASARVLAKREIAADLREERLFRSLDLSNDGYVKHTDLAGALADSGIRVDDARLAQSMASLSAWEAQVSDQSVARAQGIPQTAFSTAIRRNILLIERALQGNLVIPDFQRFCDELRELYAEAKADRSGAPADYIPQLRLREPEVDQFGVSVCTVDGQRFSIGDTDQFFTVQSTCKPINYCLALEEHGEEEVHRYVGREPSGGSFNELKLNNKNRPHNPLINAGAIMCGALIGLKKRRARLHERDSDLRGWAGRRFDNVIDRWRALAGGVSPRFSNSVYLSERETADRNFALGYFMREKGAFPADADLIDVLELYFQCCSIEVTTEIMSVVAATLANGGICPVSGERVFQTKTVQNCLSLMYSCGMYDFSGEFAFTIGLPAKSGVAGALMLVVPNVMGLCTWSPRLDEIGNSVRGVRFCQRLVSRFNFHNYDILAGPTGKRDPRVNAVQAQSRQVNGLIWASSKGDVSAVQRQLTLGADLDTADYDRRTPLHLAATEGQELMVRFFVDQGQASPAGVHLDPVDRWGGTPLDDAHEHGHQGVVAILEAAGAHRGESRAAIDSALPPTQNAALQTDPQRIVEMIWAASIGDLRAILRLVARGVPADCADYDSRTPLHLAAAEGHVEVLRYFIAHGINPNPRDRWGNTPLQDALRHEQTVAAELLRAHGAEG